MAQRRTRALAAPLLPPAPCVSLNGVLCGLCFRQVNEALGGGSFVEDEDDPFEGLTPEEIQARAALRRAGCRVHLNAR